MRSISIFVILTALLLPAQQAFCSLSAEEILAKADEVRSPQMDYIVMAKVISKKPGKADKISQYEVLLKGRNKTIIETLSPPDDRGTSLLMLNLDLWVFLPTISKPVRISLQQRLVGEVANGDIARANFSGDYTPVLKGTQTLHGNDCYVLDLSAKNDRITYSRVTLWVQKDTFHPEKAQFYAVSGKLLKTCHYENYQEVLGRLRPTRLVLTDPLVKGQESIIVYSEMKAGNLPEKMFSRTYMNRLRY